jgi:23S rRNA pseudouridine2604 synthase
MRINLAISSKGLTSRREADRWIAAGRVCVNGRLATTGMEVDEHDTIEVDGRIVSDRPSIVYLAYHKPLGIETTTDRSKPGNIVDAIDYPERVFPIGRLDKDSSGLILITNDGQIVNQILRSENEHEKEYVVTTERPYDESFLQAMSNGVEIYNPVRHTKTLTKPCVVKPLSERTFSMVLTQGLNLQIRRMAKELGHRVVKLKRIRIMHLSLGDLPPGKWRKLTEQETAILLDAASDQPRAR